MSRYVDSTEQLVTEIVVRDIRRSVEFYRRLGFELLRDGGDFVELTWEDHRLFLAELSAFRDAGGAALTTPPPFPIANLAARGFFVPIKSSQSGKIISGSPAIRDYTRITILVSIRFDAYYLIGHAVLPQAAVLASNLISELQDLLVEQKTSIEK